jgi:hypothetical protein
MDYNLFVQVELADQVFQAFPFRAVTENITVERNSAPSKQAAGTDQDIDAFLLCEAGYADDSQAGAGSLKRLKPLRNPEWKTLQVQPVVHPVCPQPGQIVKLGQKSPLALARTG